MLSPDPRRVNRGRGSGRAPFVACGRHAALAFLRHRPQDVERVLIARDAGEIEQLVREVAPGARVEAVGGDDLERLAGGASHQGVAVIGRPPEPLDPASLTPERHPVVLVLDGLTDPRNVGAVLRTAAAVGVGAAVVLRDRAPGLTPSLVKAAAGAVERVRLVRVVNLVRALGDLRDSGYWIVGLDAGGDIDLFAEDAVPALPCALVIGEEGRGLRRLTHRVCDRVLSISMQPESESLNVSVAAGIALYDLLRRFGCTALAQA